MVDEGEGINGGGGGLAYDNQNFGDGDGDEEFIGGQFENNGVLEFTRGITCSLVKGRKGGNNPKGTKHFTTERQRREHLNDKYSALRSLVPNPTKVYFLIFFRQNFTVFYLV